MLICSIVLLFAFSLFVIWSISYNILPFFRMMTWFMILFVYYVLLLMWISFWMIILSIIILILMKMSGSCTLRSVTCFVRTSICSFFSTYVFFLDNLLFSTGTSSATGIIFVIIVDYSVWIVNPWLSSTTHCVLSLSLFRISCLLCNLRGILILAIFIISLLMICNQFL